ncbi:MAG TPA: iron-sulfur cluster insertion protein ErpA [Paraburkholderia sp.]
METLHPPVTAAPDTAPAFLDFTERAAAKVASLIEEEGNPQLKLRLYVSGGGCAGFQYGFSFDDQVADDDMQIVTDGVTLLIDAMSQQYLLGARVDYEDSLEGSRFVIQNPNAQSSCGCGSSFSV